MKKQICLTQSDIQQIISNAFSVDVDKVYIELCREIEGYGTREHFVTNVKATVEVPVNEGR